MPWHIEKRDRKFCVIKDSDDSTEKCHDTEAKAKAHLRALYASEQGGGDIVKERLVADIPRELAQVEARGNTLRGYASVFNYPINSGNEVFAQTTFVKPGAFTKTLQENRERVQVLFNHGHDPRYGELPIGTISKLEQNNTGLYAEVELHDGPDNQNIRSALASGALRAMSIQFETAQESYNQDRSERYLEAISLWEFGPVTFPANAAATASLHSIAGFAVDLDQAESSTTDRRESTVDMDRLTWVLEAHRRDEEQILDLAQKAVRMAQVKEG